MQLPIADTALSVPDDALSLCVCLFEDVRDQIVPWVARERISALLYVRKRTQFADGEREVHKKESATLSET